MQDFVSLLPLIVVGAGAILLMLLAAFEKLEVETGALISMVFYGAAFFIQLVVGGGPQDVIFDKIFNGMLATSNFSMAAGLVIFGCGFFTSMSCHSYFGVNKFCTLDFYAIKMFSVCGMVLLTMAQELVTAFIALEIMSLGIYILVGYDRTRLTATEAILKYLMLGAFAGAFFTMGAALIYGGAGSTKFVAISQFIAANPAGQPLLIGGAFFIFIAIFFKIAAFPFHAWVVDVYDGASAPVTGFMATALKAAVFALFANFIALSSGFHGQWIDFLFWVAVLTMFGGNLVAIGQSNIKRMLAASGIVHSGYLLIALVAINAEQFTGSVIGYYLAAYAVGTLGMFAAMSYLGGSGEKRVNFDDFKGLAKVRPYSAAAITVFLLSMAGIPPTAGFMGKFYIITSAISAGQMALAVLGVVSSILSMWYYLRLVISMYFHDASESFETQGAPLATISTFVLVVFVFAIGLYPIVI
ncbi:NADH-quinone oxidoreductase subunit N [Desulforhopalus singaporensis]|uniref:NADH-quinone oxidoreductase subunit N n=1 Tax=Desulforhopalus singaporensis TaxID=91360 RepID=A0A1H0TS03_9BACT|nr:NADH-quinone oxidoreductase subunit N [Desulforhopalus singaporensis]SDP56749.1 NADH-quinone oxidoreductase subunit N [Desulforhopalus singaporensis]